MRIGIDAATAYDRDATMGAGIEHYTRSIIRHMVQQADEQREVLVFLPHWAPEHAENDLGRNASKYATFIRPKMPFVQGVSRHLALPAALRLRRVSVLFSPHGQVPWGWNGRSVVTVHDMSIYDHPEWFPESAGQTHSKNQTVPRSLEHADAVISVSKFTKNRLESLFPVARGKTSVVYEGVHPPEHLNGGGGNETDEDIILFLGTIEPRKNLPRAFAAFDTFLRRNKDQVATTKFIVAGKMGWKTDETMEAMEQMNHAWQPHANRDIIEYVGYVSAQEKWSLYQRAYVFFFPSLEEGFGLPVLEAMSVGTPVITSDRGALPEVGGDAVFAVDPADVEQMSLTISQCLFLPEGMTDMREEAKAHAAIFTWERAAKETLDILTRAGEANT